MADSCCWPDAFRGRDRVQRVIDEYLGAYKGFKFEVKHLMAAKDGNTVMARWRAQAMHLGGFMDAPPSGRVEMISGMTTFELRGWKICRVESFREKLGQERQGAPATDDLWL